MPSDSVNYVDKLCCVDVNEFKVSVYPGVPQTTTSRRRCFMVTHFIKTPIKYIFSESLGIVDSVDLRQEIKTSPKIVSIFQKYRVSQREFVSG